MKANKNQVAASLKKFNALMCVTLLNLGALAAQGSAEPYATVRAHSDVVTGLVFLPGRATLVSSSRDGAAKSWNLNDATAPKTLQQDVPINGIAMAGKQLVLAAEDGTVRVLSATGQLQKKIQVSDSAIKSIAAVEDGSLIVAGSSAGSLHLLDEKGDIQHLHVAHGKPVTGIAIDDKKQIYSGARDGSFATWNADGRLMARSGRVHHLWTTAICLINESLVTGGSDGNLLLHRAGIPKQVVRDKGFVNAIAASPDGKCAAVGWSNGVLHIWVDGVKAKLSLPRSITALAFSDGAELLAVGDAGGNIHLIDLSTQPLLLGNLCDPTLSSADIVLVRYFIASWNTHLTFVIRQAELDVRTTELPISVVRHVVGTAQPVVFADRTIGAIRNSTLRMSVSEARRLITAHYDAKRRIKESQRIAYLQAAAAYQQQQLYYYYYRPWSSGGTTTRVVRYHYSY